MDKLKQESIDITEQNINSIGALFPNVITETKDENGNLKKAINFTLLKQILSKEVVDGEECYEFTWVGKKQSIIDGNTPIRKTLRPCKEESKDWDTTENLYIEGDNLEVLKLLQGSYLNSIKMIYIDPPYNTGNDFIYHDNFAIDKNEYEEELGIYDENENRLFKNTELNGRFHSDWCSMIYPRLQLARNLLTDDGVIFISINDNEIDSLLKICCEVFGEKNFIATLIWDRNHSAQAGIYKTYHEYIVMFCRDIDLLGTPKSLNQDLFEAGAMKKESGRHGMQEFTFPKGTRFDATDGVELRGSWGGLEKVELVEGRMISENGKLKEAVTLKCAFTQISQMKEFFYGDKSSLVDSRGQKIVEFYLNSNGKVKVVKERGVEAPQTTCKFGAQGPISKELANLFGTEDSPFDSPKPLSMIKDFVSRFTNVSDGDIILDFFSGSATTAHAIMELNSEVEHSNRKYILVQIPENMDQSIKQTQKDGKKTLQTAIAYLESKKRPHLLTEIAKERIRLASEKIEQNSCRKIDSGFRVFRVDDSNFKNVYYTPSQYTQDMLLDLESNIKEDRTDLDLLFGVLVDWGVPLSLPFETKIIEGKSVHFVNDTDLVACFEENISESLIREVAKTKPMRVVFRDSSFTNSPDKINVTEIFKTISPDTTIKVI